jgi:transposase-like protein
MEKKNYEPAPEVPQRLKLRYETMLRVLSGSITVTEGARRLYMSRNHFQTLLHRGLKGLLAGITPGEAGRPGKPPAQAALEREVQKLRQENERLRERTELIDRLIGVASGVIQGRVRTSRTRKMAKGGGNEGDEPDGARFLMRVEAHRALRLAGLPAPIACAVVGASPATLRRWRKKVASEKTAGHRPASPAPLELRERVAALVRSLRGLIGADALRRAVPGISRRQAAAVKAATLTEMEHERVAAAKRVHVTVPGVLRGFDAMHASTSAGPRHVLIAGDAAVPFRTSALPVQHYDERAVVKALERDFALHGPPIVLRADRWKAHDAPRVRELLQSYKVLLLHGPPHHPGYYGQLERQNREHRAWLSDRLDANDLHGTCDRMLDALNCEWPRRSLGWLTAQQVWTRRPAVDIDRDALREEVQDRAARIRRRAEGRAAVVAMAERLAIESALQRRGLLRWERGGWC